MKGLNIKIFRRSENVFQYGIIKNNIRTIFYEMANVLLELHINWSSDGF